MSNIIKLLAVSLLLIGCKGMYGDDMGKMKKGYSAAKHAINHVDHVNRSVAASASATTTLAKQLPIN